MRGCSPCTPEAFRDERYTRPPRVVTLRDSYNHGSEALDILSLTVSRPSVSALNLRVALDAGVIQLHRGNGFITIARQHTRHIDHHRLCGVCMLNVIQHRTATWGRKCCTALFRHHAAGDGLSSLRDLISKSKLARAFIHRCGHQTSTLAAWH